MPRKSPIIAYHIVFGAYGFWLPNDPRGSWSKYVWANRLQQFGPPQQRARHEPILAEEKLRSVIKEELTYPPVRFSGLQARAVARGFCDIISRLNMVVYATAIMPDHVHLVVARQEMYAETIAGYLKRSASRNLRKEDLHPLREFVDHRGRLPSPWEALGWKVFLHNEDEIEAAIYYVNNNPVEAGLRAQNWWWIQRYAP